MGLSEDIYRYSRDDEIAANLMALNGADPISVYKRQTSSARNLGIVFVAVGGFMLVFPIVGVPMILFGIIILSNRYRNIKKIESQLAKKQANASKSEREQLKEEVRREMLKEELRAEIKSEKSPQKSVKKKK